MTLSNADQLQSHLSSIVQIAISLGVFIRVGTDLQEFKSICENIPTKGGVGPAFDSSEVETAAENGMWITGHLANGEVVHTQAMKVINLNNTTLRQHFEQHLSDFRVGGTYVDVENSPWRLTEQAGSIRGQVAYHGELWLKGGDSGVRGGCLATILTRLLLIMGLFRWNPDFFIGIQAAHTSCKGLAAREGYMRTEQRMVQWNIGPDQMAIEGWLVWMSREEAEFNLDVPPETFYAMLEKKSDTQPRAPIVQARALS